MCKIEINFLSISLNMCFGCSKAPSHRDGSFEYAQHLFWLRNKKNNFQLLTLMWGPVTYIHSLAMWCLNVLPEPSSTSLPSWVKVSSTSLPSWVKVFRIIPEFRILRLTFYFRILRLTFYRNSASKS